ncbi:MAG: hypothetical protein IKQ93_07390 [Candidatus Methanomethylophilaceae archaeon]|nr:hypothetical protein [Candidatus Methanomethylophilaceae archaeon]MBR6910231.1 hypothetical protein [Candidatus Methanomethylophilaceae archaeon]
MDNATSEMKMPTNYVDMSAAEIEFDGGWSWKTFFTAVAIVGAVAIAGGAGLLLAGSIVGLAGGAVASTLVAAGGITMAAGTAVGAIGYFNIPGNSVSGPDEGSGY